MKTLREIRFPIFIIFIVGLMGVVFLPVLPVDETRYLSVAWEMRIHHSWILPLLNGAPYSQKPPLLFWMVNLLWTVFGVNRFVPRLAPVAFSFLCVLLIYKMSLKLWSQSRIARCAAMVLATNFMWMLWTPLIMFDVILSFWILLVVYQIMIAFDEGGLTPWLLAGLALGAGVLTKGPVVFVHVLPAAIAYPLLRKDRVLSWKTAVGPILALLIAGAMTAAWVIPAIRLGGEAYKKDILMSETARRVVSSFAHPAPVWWYLPLIPVLLLPWSLIPRAWAGQFDQKRDWARRWLIFWILTTVIIFSLISGKRIHYLVPEIPIVSLLIARNLVGARKLTKRPYAFFITGALYVATAVTLCILPRVTDHGLVHNLNRLWGWPVPLGLFVLGASMFFWKAATTDRFFTLIGTSALAGAFILVGVGHNLFRQYDLTQAAQFLKQKENQGFAIFHKKKYRGEYHFLGRLRKPIRRETDEKILAYARTHEKVLLITRERRKKEALVRRACFFGPYGWHWVAFWDRAGIFFRLGAPPPPDRAKDKTGQSINPLKKETP